MDANTLIMLFARGKKFLLFLVAHVFMGCTIAAAQHTVKIVPAFPSISFEQPVGLNCAPHDQRRLFIVERRGVIKFVQNDKDTKNAEVFLNITERVDARGAEEGLLGLAFHPNYKENGDFFVYYTPLRAPLKVLSRFKVSAGNSNVADVNSEKVLLEIPQPYTNHNGGQIAFGPDGYLYIGVGDGGSGGDPHRNGQNTNTLLGKLLRIDVDKVLPGYLYGIPADNPFRGQAGKREEIFAYGLRNPWRFSFDSVTKQLWLADVGQNKIEEVDIIQKGGNYGWNIMEGSSCFEPPSGCSTAGLIKPIHEYSHELGLSITGGYVYRGEALPWLQGYYVYGDFVTGRIWGLKVLSNNKTENIELAQSGLMIASFGVDTRGELYIVAYNGALYRLS